jgi:hypothetical protein
MRIELVGSRDAATQGASFPCQRVDAAVPTNETMVLFQMNEGKSYDTNVFPSPSCTITLTSLTDTKVTGTFSGTIFDQTDTAHPASPFSGSFVAARLKK